MWVIRWPSKVLRKQWRAFKRFSNQKSFPPMVKKSEKEIFEKPTKTSRDIFGATILPQNLSFENTKKLTYNEIRLEDIPLVDESEVAEAMIAEKINNNNNNKINNNNNEIDIGVDHNNNKNENKNNQIDDLDVDVEAIKEVEKDDDVGIVVIQTDLMQQTKKSLAEVFSSTLPVKNILRPYMFQNLGKAFKHLTSKTSNIPILQYMKENAVIPIKNLVPVVKLPEILGGKIVLISRPEHVSEIFEQDKRYPIDSVLDSIQRSRLQNQCKNPRTDSHLTEEWIILKNLFNLENICLKEKRTEKYFEEIEEAGQKFVRRIKAIRNSENEVPGNFLYEINKWSLECLGVILFDKRFEFLNSDNCPNCSNVSRLLYSLTSATKSLCELEKGFQLWRLVNTYSLSSLGCMCHNIENVLSELIENAQQNIIKKQRNEDVKTLTDLSYAESLLLEKDSSPDDIISIILDILLIGMNTMSSALSFLLYHISINSQAQSRMYKEVKDLLPEKYSRLEYEQLSFLKYTQACLKESLRLKLPIPYLTRVVSKNVTLNNYEILKGTFVLIAAQFEVMKEKNFDEPFQFIPERWLDSNVHHPFVTLPLSHFYANGFQRHLAETSAWVCAALIMKHFSVKFFRGEIEATNTVISFPNKPLKFVFTDRTA